MKRFTGFILLTAAAAILTAASKRDAPLNNAPLVLESSDLTPRPGRILTYKVTKTGNGVSARDTLSVTCAGTASIPAAKVKSAYVVQSPLFEVYREVTGKEINVHSYAFTKLVSDVVIREWVKEKRLAFPLKIGAKWEGGSIPAVFGVSQSRAVTKTTSYRVAAEEILEVPAGRYRCLKVEMKVKAKGLPPEFQKRCEKAVTYRWYAKGVGLVKSESVSPVSGVVETRELTGTVEPGADATGNAISSIKLAELLPKRGRIHYYSYSGGGYRGTIGISDYAVNTFLGDFGTGVKTIKYTLKRDAFIQMNRHPFLFKGPFYLYLFPLEKGKEWKTIPGYKGMKRKVESVEVVGTPYRSYVSMRIDTRDTTGKLVLEEWVVPGAGVVKWIRHKTGASETYELEYLLDDSGARSPCRIPFTGGARKCTNAWAIGPSRTSHRGWSRFAVDFHGPPDTPVHAARGGTVVAVKADSRTGGNSDKYIADANFVIIRHEDDTYGVYYHLKHDSVKVKVGEEVKQRKLIGRIGLTGWTRGPHLHFYVHNGITSIPVAFADIPTDYGIPKRNKTYKPR